MTHARVLKPRALMWLPAAALVVAALLAAAGVQFIGTSKAATGTSTVSATVNPEIHIGGTCPGYAPAAVTLNTGDATTALGSCTLTFGTNNNAAGAIIRVESTRPSGTNSFCTAALGAACGASTFTDASTAGAASLTDGQYGVRVTAAPTCSSATWTNGNYYGIGNAATAGAGNAVCNQTTTTDASYALQFAANPATNTPSGTYQADAVFTVAAN